MKHIIKRIKSAIDGKPRFELDEQHKVVPAFMFEGIQYYQFDDINNTMTGRAFTIIDFYNELSMRCTREYLTEHCTAVDEMVNSGNIIGLAQLNIQLKERLEMIIDPDIVYKIASVVYFDATEQPYTYDHKYNHKKIEKWKSIGVEGFFLKIPLKDLIPSLTLSKTDLVQYIKVAKSITKKHLETISTLRSEMHKKTAS